MSIFLHRLVHSALQFNCGQLATGVLYMTTFPPSRRLTYLLLLWQQTLPHLFCLFSFAVDKLTPLSQQPNCSRWSRPFRRRFPASADAKTVYVHPHTNTQTQTQ
ncbi:unnamed protein product [Protopolystoma xenopodis]|uniref:Uncharacterized protein n=1 Tax=Protopolystoma xenopodis TaxID=117903 RepID=A0A448XHM2_9PLAT|nr:unnamed protein product [Protopolystoma xenopodis]